MKLDIIFYTTANWVKNQSVLNKKYGAIGNTNNELEKKENKKRKKHNKR